MEKDIDSGPGWKLIKDARGQYWLLEVWTDGCGVRRWKSTPMTSEVVWARYEWEAPRFMRPEPSKRTWWQWLLGRP